MCERESNKYSSLEGPWKGKTGRREAVRVSSTEKEERESQQKFVITVLHFYLIMNEDFIVQHPVQIHLRLKSFLPETIGVSAEA